MSHLDPGSFTLVVDDLSSEHDFHLQGPGVDVSTDIAGTGTKSFNLTLVDGQYTFICDAHPNSMAGGFTVGIGPPPAPKPKPKSATRLVLTLSGKSTTLTTPSGKAVKALATGPATVTVRDRSATRGVSLRGAGVNRSTTARFKGTVTWEITLSRGSLVYGAKPGAPGGKVQVS